MEIISTLIVGILVGVFVTIMYLHGWGPNRILPRGWTFNKREEDPNYIYAYKVD